MRKVYKYLIAWVGTSKNGEVCIGNTFLEYGEPLDTQKSIEKAREDINRLRNLEDCSIMYMKRVKVERLESGKNGKE